VRQQRQAEKTLAGQPISENQAREFLLLQQNRDFHKKHCAELQASLNRLHGARFSDRVYSALRSRAETAEAEVKRQAKRLEELDGSYQTEYDEKLAAQAEVEHWKNAFHACEEEEMKKAIVAIYPELASFACGAASIAGTSFHEDWDKDWNELEGRLPEWEWTEKEEEKKK